ncbi:hypothetical protein M8D54_004970 [Salmonella enterica]|uniref:Uncharacterized protein n=1 Tax=Salmonella enterica TaxID=28901 RepID=A0A629KMB5_SALER|nr:hypothetical protein [Salmonella enterica]EDF8922264.1 hypothetical protein [Salmonella enterica]EGR6194428.1 hypothetical protein [Salmonella enterica]EHR7428496.1 hypothetical protein [Salmonella enterica]EJF2005552.1 hypothetical protein [Salmonella enterica]
MKILIQLSNDWPENVSGNPVLDEWIYNVPWFGIEYFLLCEDGKVYQSYIKMPFSIEITEFQLFKHIHIDETSFILQATNEWPDGVNIRKGFISRRDERHLYNKKENGCWYVSPEGNDAVIIFDAPEIQEHKNRYNRMPIITYEVLD